MTSVWQYIHTIKEDLLLLCLVCHIIPLTIFRASSEQEARKDYNHILHFVLQKFNPSNYENIIAWVDRSVKLFFYVSFIVSQLQFTASPVSLVKLQSVCCWSDGQNNQQSVLPITYEALSKNKLIINKNITYTPIDKV